jgi:hypothetical protein
MDDQENIEEKDVARELVDQLTERFYHEEDDPKRKQLLKKRHFRLKLYEYCFRILYGDYPLRQITDTNPLPRSQSFDDKSQQESPKMMQRKESTLSLELRNNRFLDELNRQLEKAQRSTQLAEEKRKKHKESQQIFDDLLNNKEDSSAEVKSGKFEKNKKSAKEGKIPTEVKQNKEPQPEAPKKFEFLRKSNYKKLDDVKTKHYYMPKKYQDIHRSTTSNTLQKPVTNVQPDYSKRFSSIPVVSRRATSLQKRRNVVEREIEADRQALKEIVATKSAKSPKSLTVTESEAKTPADTERSWISEKKANEDELNEKEDEVNFERSWSAWSLKKAELLEWDPDFDCKYFCGYHLIFVVLDQPGTFSLFIKN